MKIHLDNVNLTSRSGPNSFARRFVDCVKTFEHEIVNESAEADISLVFIERSGRPLAKKFVHRLDGIWFAPDQFESHNKNIKKTYEDADCVIWQSEFDKNMTTKWWSSPKRGHVIQNGAPRSFLKNQQLENHLNFLKQKHEKIFVCSSNWHPQKRLSDNIDMFLHLKSFYPTACLLILGSNPNILKNVPDAYVTGNLPHDACMQIYESSDWMIHLAWLDHCPNTVVEAITCDTPVICSSDGGTKEVVGNFGLILKEDQNYQFQLTNYDSPPSIDVKQVKFPLPEKQSLKKNDVSIEESVKKYLKVFDELLKK